jgi:hypothetical protein
MSTQPKINCHLAFTVALELAALPGLALVVVLGVLSDCLTRRVPQWGHLLWMAENFCPQWRQLICGIKPIVPRPFQFRNISFLVHFTTVDHFSQALPGILGEI